ncbi:hypothetical protein [Desulfovibrio sp. JC022]|uniref:hypothetical protein n=1 Tax=Desulfovibrio sp. JC022 TaxID=2593642 RepID=UPI0013D26226|nr:hypothetical protein [Desulfovibrio sp. JC022]NDV21898.1 hypothetical protein [Desulfovibrio sp. JC022]
MQWKNLILKVKEGSVSLVRYLWYFIIGIMFLVGLMFIMPKLTKTICCQKCGQEYGVLPLKDITRVTVVIFILMLLGDIFVLGEGISFICYLTGITVVYYLLKKEGYKCPNCKTINQLP